MAEEFYSLVTDYGAEKQLRCITDVPSLKTTNARTSKMFKRR